MGNGPGNAGELTDGWRATGPGDGVGKVGSDV